MAAAVVTFDAGQTLVDLDLDFLARRLGERGLVAEPTELAAAAPAAWRRYDLLVEAGGGHPWHGFMTALLEGARLPAGEIAPVVDWLWSEQPRRNLWRRPIADMVELARELAGQGMRVAVLSNSEGRLAELFVEIGIADAFHAIVDSGRVGVDKPDPRIFEHALDAVGATSSARAVHVGDSWSADVLGAVGAGWRAVWYRSREGASPIARPDAPGRLSPMPPAPAPLPFPASQLLVARDAAETRVAIHAFGL